jgi:hypothetical protein
MRPSEVEFMSYVTRLISSVAILIAIAGSPIHAIGVSAQAGPLVAAAPMQQRPPATATPVAPAPTGQLVWPVSEHVWQVLRHDASSSTSMPGFAFRLERVDYESETAPISLSFLGGATIEDPAAGWRLELTNPALVVRQSGEGGLLATVRHCADPCVQWSGPFRVTVATFQLERTPPDPATGQIRWTINPAYASQGDPDHPELGQFPQPFLASLAEGLRPHFMDTLDEAGEPSEDKSLKVPAPISVAFTRPGPMAPAASTALGSLTWGVKESYRNYVLGPIAHGNIAVANGAVQNRDDTFLFPATTTNGATIASFSGQLHFTGHDGQLDMTITNPRLSITGSTGTLSVDITSTSQDGGPAIAYQNVALATLDLAGITPLETAAGRTWTNVPTILTATGARAFGGNYRPGQALDSVSFTLSRQQ